MIRNAALLLSAAALFAACAPATTAEAADQECAGTITVSGQGSATGEPDIAIIRLGVEARRETAREAMATANAAAASVLTALESAGVEKRDIQTDRLTVSAQYDYRPQQQGGRPRLTGYLASNNVSAKVRKTDQAGTVIDAAIRAGANNLGGVSFAFDDPTPLLNEARRSAVKDAVAKAKLYADAAGVKAGRIIEISDALVAGAPRTRVAAMRAEADNAAFAPAPVEPGELSLSAHVTLIVEIE